MYTVEEARRIVLEEATPLPAECIPLLRAFRRSLAEDVFGDVVGVGGVGAGDTMTASTIGALAAAGHPEVCVHRRPKVAIISSGSELVYPAEHPGPGKIRSSNAYMLAGQVKSAGGEPLLIGIVRDDEATTRAAFESAAGNADVVISSGGAHLGDFDYTFRALNQVAEIKYSRVSMKPASYQVHGLVGGKVPFFGLPGNPSATFIAFEVLVRPLLLRLQGRREVERTTVRAILEQGLKKKPGYTNFVQGKITNVAEQKGQIDYRVGLVGGKSSPVSTMHLANCLIVLPESQGGAPAGSPVTCMRLDVEEGTA
ncbi:MAG: molybdopterin molybdotransferase MoeA [Coriobacteriia bacterium]